MADGRKYLLIGPGRWGSADRWLGIPVSWSDICGVSAMVETTAPELKADPSQGSHFFHNITSLGITYITVSGNGPDYLDWDWLNAQAKAEDLQFMAHVQLDQSMRLKVDGRSSHCVILIDEPEMNNGG